MYLGEARSEQERADLALIIEETLNQRIQGVKNESGVWVTPAFPKLIYVLEEDNVREGSKYWYLTELAARCTAKRMVPDYISEKKMLEYKIDKNGEGHCYTCMGCRSFLTPYVTRTASPSITAASIRRRHHQPRDVALSSGGDKDKFWEVFDERLELCHRALMYRHNRFEGHALGCGAHPLAVRRARAAPKGAKTIDKLLYGGLFDHLFGLCGSLRVRQVYDGQIAYG